MIYSKIKIGKQRISNNQPVFIIAEAGVNHNARLDLALRLVDAAAAAGADAVKFQTFKAEQVVTASGEMADYQKRNLGKDGRQLAMLKKLELKEKFYKPLIERCRQRKIIFLSTPHGGFESVDFLKKINVPAFKFGSGDLTNLPLLAYAARLGKPMIISAGMANLSEIKQAVKTIQKSGNKKIIVLHCTTNYPCPSEEVNLRSLRTIMKLPGVLAGYSDHTDGSQAAMMAATLGACVIEKHFTLDKSLPGPDHKASVEPEELAKTIQAVRSVEVLLGSAVKQPTKSEITYLPLVRKSLVAVKDIKKGEKFTETNLGIKRPGHGLAPENYFKVKGLFAKTDIQAGQLIEKNHFA